MPLKSSPPRRSWLRRWLRRLGLVLVTLLVLFFGLVIYHRTIGNRRLAAAIAATDRLDPQWHWDDLLAQRLTVPESENAAPIVLAAARLLPETWPPKPAPDNPFREQPTILERIRQAKLPEQLDADLIKDAKAELAKVSPALAIARRLTGFRTGRYPDLSFADYHFSAKLTYLQQCRQVANVLWVDAALQAQDGKADASVDASRCVLIAGRSIGDEPGLIGQLVRYACRYLAVEGLERALAEGQASEKVLTAMQLLLEDEETQNTLVLGLRGDRAFRDQILNWVDACDSEHLAGIGDDTVARMYGEHPWAVKFCHFFIAGWFRENRAVMLELASEAVEIARLPLDEQVGRFKELDRKAKMIRGDEWPMYRYALGCLAIPAEIKVAEAFHRSRAELRCAAAALAAERYRLARGHWPERLDQLVPQFLAAVPVDPYDGHPLKLGHRADGIVVYSTGPDGVDNGGHVDRTQPAYTKDLDLGFRLWNVKSRRQPPPVRLPDNAVEDELP